MDPHPQNPRDGAELVAQLERVRALARQLVRDHASADDLVQEAGLVAIAHPDEARRGGAGWLRAVLGNLAARLRRSGARRAKHERAAARPERVDLRPTPLETLEVVSGIVAAIRSLPEPYRSTLVAQHLEQRSPSAIARDAGVPVQTVKTRLKRGLTQLRARLDLEHGGDRRSWLVPLLPLASARGARWAAGALAAPALLTGALLMKTKLVATAVLVLGAGLWWAWPESESTGSQRVEAREAGAATIADATPAEPSVQVAAVPLARDGNAAPSVSNPDEAGPVLELVAEGSGEPLAGAIVYHGIGVEPGSQPTRADLLLSDFDEEATLAKSLPSLRADEKGLVRLPEFSGQTMVSASAPGRWKTASLVRCDGPRFRLELSEALGFTVEVVDRDGTPVPGIPVVFDAISGRSPLTWGRGITGKDGRFTFRNKQIYRNAGGAYPIVTRLGWNYPTVPAVDLDWKALPKVSVRLVLPETGRVTIEVVDEDGRPFLEPALVGIGPPRSPYDLTDEELARRLKKHWVAVHDGRAVFEHVGLGLELVAVLFVADGGRATSETKLSGPTRPGEEVRASVTAGGRLAVLRGRALRPDGRPLANADLEFAYSSAQDRFRDLREPMQARTSADGTFTKVLKRVPPAMADRELRFRASGKPPETLPLSATHPVPASLGDAANCDLGDVVFREPPLLASGKVVDERGVAVPGALVYANENVGWWNPVNASRTYTLDDGSFTILDEDSGNPTKLVADREGFARCETDPVAFGVKDHRLLLTRQSSIEGRVLLPEGLPADAIEVEVRHAEARPDAGRPDVLEARVTADGAFRASLRPGTASLVISLARSGSGWDAEQILRIADLELEPAATCRDERIQAIDLRPLLRVVKVSVRDEARTPVSIAELRLHTIGAEPDQYLQLLASGAGTCTLALGREEVELAVAKKGYATAFTGRLDADREVVLHPDLAVPVAVTGLDAFKGQDLRFSVSATRILRRGLSLLHLMEAESDLRADGSALLRLPQTGRYDFAISVQRGRFARSVIHTTITVPETTGDRAPATITIPDGAIAAALAELPK